MRIASRPTTLLPRCNGSSTARPWAAWRFAARKRRPSRADALRFYTLGSAWFSFDENKRGSLEPGKLADLAVLSKDYLTVPVEQIGSLESVLTMVAGRVVYAVPPYK